MSSSATTSPSRRGLWRWSVASVATAALVVSGSGLVVFAQSGTGESQGPLFAPADAAAYVEARLDMPAGQDAAMAELMTAFPGFADPGSFDMKKNELFAMLGDQLGVIMPEGDLIGDVFTGEIGIAMGDLESAMMGEDPSLIAGMAMADAEAAASLMEAIVVEGPLTLSESTYNGVTIVTDDSSSPPMSLAMHGDWMLMGTGPDAVADSIDVLDGTAPSLAEDPDFTAAWSRLPSARLGGAWMDFTSFTSLIDLAAMMAEGEVGMALPTQDIAAMLPQDMTASLAAENDRLTLEVLMTPGEQTPGLAVGQSELAMAFPGDTQVYFEARELGAIVEDSLNAVTEMMAAMPAEEGVEGMSEIDMLLSEDSPVAAMLGVPLPEFLDFVGDAGVGAGLSSDGLWLGIAAEIDDDAVGQERVTSLMTILRLATSQMAEDGISMETNDVGGVEVTTINLPIDSMVAEAGVPLTMGDSIDVAIFEDTLLMGMGDFVESAILSDGTDSLGDNAGYLDALGEDTVNSGVTYMNISSLLTALDPLLSMMAPEWTQIAPYATGVDRMIMVGTADDEVAGMRMTVIADQ
jgi:hypothetical protein